MNIDICVVDNNSTDNTVEQLRINYPQVKIIKNIDNLGYSKAVNIGVNSTDSDFVIISNADVIYNSGTISCLFDYLNANPKAGVVAPSQYYTDGRLQYSYGLLPGWGLILRNIFYIQPLLNRIKSIHPHKVQYLDGAVMAVRTEVFKKVAGFSEEYFFYSEDADFCKKVTINGYDNIHLPAAKVIHLRGASTNIGGINENALDLFVKAKIRLAKKYAKPYIQNIYFKSELFNNKIACILFKLIHSVKKSPNTSFKLQYYNKLSAAWKSNINSIKNM